MALDVNQMISKSAKLFSDQVVARIKGAKFCMNDIYNLTRDDVDQEFKEFRFGIRKSLWIFFQSFREQEDDATSVPIYSGRRGKGRETTSDRSTPQNQTTVIIVPSAENGISPIHHSNEQDQMDANLDYVPSSKEMARLAIQPIEQDESENDEHINSVTREIECPSDQNTSNLSDGGEASGYYTLTPIQECNRKRKRNELGPEFVSTVEEIEVLSERTRNKVDLKVASSDMHEPEPEVEFSPGRKRNKIDLKFTSSDIQDLESQFETCHNVTESELVERLSLNKLNRKPPVSLKQLPKSYPEDLPSKFPFAPSVRKFLNTHTEIHSEKYDYHHITRIIFHTAGVYASKDLTLFDYKTICMKICEEYPNLLLDGSCEALYQSMRKKFSSLRAQVRKAVKHAVSNASGSVKLPKAVIVKPADYPPEMPFPVPVSPLHKKMLICGMLISKAGDEFQVACHNAIVRELVYTLGTFMPQGISFSARRAVSESLCAQYPTLQEELPGKMPWSTLDSCIRKCISSLKRGQRCSDVFQND